MNAAPRTFEAFSVVSRRDLAAVRTLARSFSEHHDGQRLKVFVVDHPTETHASNEPFDSIDSSDLGLDKRQYHGLAAVYPRGDKLAFAIIPWVADALLAGGASATIAIDPYVAVLGHLAVAGQLAADHGLVLFSRTGSPLPNDFAEPGEEELLRSGIFSDGLIGLGPGAADVLKWWQQRSYRTRGRRPGEILNEAPDHWLALAAAFFQPRIVNDPSLLASYWNLDSDDLGVIDDSLSWRGKAIRALHLPRFDPERPYWLSGDLSERPRVLISRHAKLAELCEQHAEQLQAEGWGACEQQPYGFARAADGFIIDSRTRRICRGSLTSGENGSERIIAQFPDPFDDATSSEAFVDWLKEPAPAPETGTATGLPRYLDAVWRERADLQIAFPAPDGVDRGRFFSWLRNGNSVEPPVPRELMPVAKADEEATQLRTRRPKITKPTRHGVNLVGYLRAESGVGEHGRLFAKTLEEAGIPHAIIPFEKTRSRQDHPYQPAAGADPIYDVNLICVNADQVPVFVRSIGLEFFENRYSIGLWAWEVDVLPPSMAANADYIDEIWANSRHAAAAIETAVGRPVMPFPLPIDQAKESNVQRADLGLPDDAFLFLFCFDYDSVFARKNPLATLDAFLKAFPEPVEIDSSKASEASPGSKGSEEKRRPVLVFKTINADHHLEHQERLRHAAAGRPDILFLDGYLEAEQQTGLMGLCDVYVSLHRAEGFGLTLAEAMARGKPVVATGHSGNLDFMDQGNSFLVPYRLINVPEDSGPYPTSATWAEADSDAAAKVMRRLFENPQEAEEVGRLAQQSVRDHHGPDSRARLMIDRIDEIRRLGLIKKSARRAPLGSEAIAPIPGDATEIAEALLVRGPQVDRQSVLGWPGRAFRRLVMRTIRNYDLHLRELIGSLIASDRQKADEAHQDRARLEAQIEAIESQLARERDENQDLSTRLRRLESGSPKKMPISTARRTSYRLVDRD